MPPLRFYPVRAILTEALLRLCGGQTWRVLKIDRGGRLQFGTFHFSGRNNF